MTVQLTLAIARIRQTNSDRVVGAGFLVSDIHIITCAHVVNTAISRQPTALEEPNQKIYLDFPLVAPEKIFRGRVVCWKPFQPSSSILPQAGADITLLELEGSPPEKTQPVRLVKAENLWKHPFRVFGFPEGRSEGVWTDGLINNPQANGRVQIEVVRGSAYSIEPGFSGSPVWDDQLDGVAGMTVAIDSRRPEVRTAFIIPTIQLISACPELEEQAIRPCPYKGLFAFREQDAQYFFGRKTFTQQLVQAVRRQSLVAVIGASGSGKSSVVFAGLIPQLSSEGGWLIREFRPGDRPLWSLAASLVPLLETQMSETDQLVEVNKQARAFKQGELSLKDVVRRILEKNAGSRLLLIADQFEEVYTPGKNNSEIGIFLDQLLEAVNQTENFTLVLTLRADFFGYALSYRPFADALQDADRKIGPMNRRELQDVIEKPAQLLGVRIESGLTERILKVVEKQPGYLPLLEFALTLLWAKQQNGQLTHQAYEEIGGVEKALAEYAEEQYESLSEEDQQKAQQVFIQLVRPGKGTEDTRRLATRDEVGEDNWDLVTKLASARLVVTNKTEKFGEQVETDQQTVEIIHEALIREWGKLRGWMEANREFRTWQERLKIRMEEWETSGRDDEALLRGVSLGEAEEWLHKRREELSPAQKNFIQLSLTEWNREKEQKERQEREKLETQVAWETSEKEKDILAEANKKANRRIRFGSGILAISFVGIIIGMVIAGKANQKLLLANQQLKDVATGLNNLGELYDSQGRYAEAEPLYKQALETRQKLLGTEHPDVAQSLNNLAGVYDSQGRYVEAEPLYKQVLETRQKLLGSEHPDLVQSLNNLAGVYHSQERYAEAELLYKQALETRQKLLGAEHPDVAQSLENLAGVYSSQGNIASALQFFEGSLEVEEKNLTRNLLAGSESQKQDYLKTISGSQYRVMSFHLQRVPDHPSAIALAFTTILRRKGRLLDFLVTSRRLLRQQLDSQGQQWLDELNILQTQLSTLLYNPPKNLSPENYRREFANLEQQTKELEDKISRRSSKFQTATQPVTLEDIQQLIPVNAALVEFVQYDSYDFKARKWGEPRYGVYVLGSEGQPQGIDLGTVEEIESALALFRLSLRDKEIPRQELQDAARELDQKLMQPVRQLLGSRQHILISPDSNLNLIPFEALVDENNRYLVENYRFTYLSSGRDLLRFTSTSVKRSQESVLLGNPNFSNKGDVTIRRDFDVSEWILTRLPGTEEEVKAIGELLGVEPLLGTAATEEAVKQVESPFILHIATHGFFRTAKTRDDAPTVDSNSLLRSGLVLAGFKQEQTVGENGLLTALEATGLNLYGTELVVLSACDTGLGGISPGEGIYGLRRAFAIAGSQSQLISLWKVDDKATKELMVKYYQRLLEQKMGRTEALRKTQLEMLTGETETDYSHPYYWASFIPSGNWRPID